MRSEYDKAVKGLKMDKAAGIDQIPAEIIVNMGESNHEVMYKLMCNMYNSGAIPDDFAKNIMGPIPK